MLSTTGVRCPKRRVSRRKLPLRTGRGYASAFQAEGRVSDLELGSLSQIRMVPGGIAGDAFARPLVNSEYADRRLRNAIRIKMSRDLGLTAF